MPSCVSIVTLEGGVNILRLQPLLAELSARFSQPGAADYVEYFLHQPYTGGKVPHLFLLTSEPGNLTPESIHGAVLLHRYRMAGLPLPIFVSEDYAGERNVLAPAGERSAVAQRIVAHLLRRKAHLVVLSLKDASYPPDEPIVCPQTPPLRNACWSTAQRDLTRYFPLACTYDGTLAALGKHTRRNLRYYRRLVEADLGATFVPYAEIAEGEFVALNPLCAYPTPEHVAHWRYQSTHTIPGGVFCGLRASDGRWLSILGGRRYHGTMAIDWQMNRTGLEHYSLSTVMRACVIEHEVGLGTRQLLFEGGTPHSMHLSFPPDQVTDLIAARRGLPFHLLRNYPTKLLPEGNFLAQTLSRDDLQWQPW